MFFYRLFPLQLLVVDLDLKIEEKVQNIAVRTYVWSALFSFDRIQSALTVFSFSYLVISHENDQKEQESDLYAWKARIKPTLQFVYFRLFSTKTQVFVFRDLDNRPSHLLNQKKKKPITLRTRCIKMPLILCKLRRIEEKWLLS